MVPFEEKLTSGPPTRTFGKYPEIQKDYPYSDQCISALISKMKKLAGAPREEYGKRQPGERCMYERYRTDLATSNTKTTPLAQVQESMSYS